jgi:hypothetical protein
MKTMRIFFSLMVFFVIGTKSQLALAQLLGSDSSNADDLLISGQIIIPASASCLLNIFNPNAVNKNVIRLPPLSTTTLDDNAAGPVTAIELNLNSEQSDSQCSFGGATITFDSDLAAVSPRSGLLRNNAQFRPAENVFLQIGLLGINGEFTPIDLNQPQFLNQALNPRPALLNVGSNNLLPATTPKNASKLGVRYVTTRDTAAKLSTLASDKTGSKDVTAGNVSVFLPFLIKLN